MISAPDLPRRLARLPVVPSYPGARAGAGSSAFGSGAVVGVVGRGSLVLFLALYLLLLAFFIMLTALSSLERQRAEAVMDSLTLTFAPGRAPTEVMVPLDDLTGNRRAAEAFMALVTDLFRSAVPTVRWRETVPGRAVELRMRADALFEPDTDRLRRPRQAMLDSVVAALAGAPPGLRFELAMIPEVTETRDANDVAILPIDGTHLATRRAGHFGRFMNQRGAAKGSVLVGLAPGDPDWLRIVVRAVDVTRWDPDLTNVPADAVAIDAVVGPGDDASDDDASDDGAGSFPQAQPPAGIRGAQDGGTGAMMPPFNGDAMGDTPPGRPIARPPVEFRPAMTPADGGGRGGTIRGGEDQETPNQNDGTARERTAQ